MTGRGTLWIVRRDNRSKTYSVSLISRRNKSSPRTRVKGVKHYPKRVAIESSRSTVKPGRRSDRSSDTNESWLCKSRPDLVDSPCPLWGSDTFVHVWGWGPGLRFPRPKPSPVSLRHVPTQKDPCPNRKDWDPSSSSLRLFVTSPTTVTRGTPALPVSRARELRPRFLSTSAVVKVHLSSLTSL